VALYDRDRNYHVLGFSDNLVQSSCFLAFGTPNCAWIVESASKKTGSMNYGDPVYLKNAQYSKYFYSNPQRNGQIELSATSFSLILMKK